MLTSRLLLTGTIRPGERNGSNSEEEVAVVRNTSKHVVPSKDSSDDAESTTRLAQGGGRTGVCDLVLQRQEEESHIKGEEEREEHDS